MTDVGSNPAFYRTALFVCAICVLSWLLLTGCQSRTKEPQKVKELEYTVLEPLEQPEEVKKVVEERKEEPFQFVYSDG